MNILISSHFWQQWVVFFVYLFVCLFLLFNFLHICTPLPYISIYIEIELLGCETEEVLFLLIMRNCFNTVKHPKVILNHSFSWKMFKVHSFSVKLKILVPYFPLLLQVSSGNSLRFFICIAMICDDVEKMFLCFLSIWLSFTEFLFTFGVSLQLILFSLIFFSFVEFNYTFQLSTVCQKCTL